MMEYSDGAVRISVTCLVGYAFRTGDIDLRRSTGEMLSEGGELHRELQAGRGDGYTPEVRLSDTTDLYGFLWNVNGIADGVFGDGDGLTVEEIKTVRNRLPKSADERHTAQARCYAYFLCKLRGLDRIRVRVTYYSAETKKEKSFENEMTKDELFTAYTALLSRLVFRASDMKTRETSRIPSVRSLSSFPFSGLREGQDDLIRQVYRSVRNRRNLFAEAPTGIGKTISTLYPSVRALGDGLCSRIFYLTAKASTRREAYSAAKMLFEHGAKLRTCVLNSRESMCVCEAAKGNVISSYCNPDDCRYAVNYYDRAELAIKELIGKCNGYSRSVIAETAKRFGICPYELSLDLSEFCDIIICDYNYVFDPSVYLRRYFDIPKTNSVFLIDEAHNLPDRARSMYSCELKRSEFEELYRLTGEEEKELGEITGKVVVALRGLRRLCRDNLTKDTDGERGFYMSANRQSKLDAVLNEFIAEADKWRRINRGHQLYATVTSLASGAKKYMTLASYYDEAKFLTYIEILGNDTRLRVFCLDPSGVISERLKKSRSAVLFSATFTPLDYFTELCGGDGNNCDTLLLGSPFPQNNLCVAAVDTVSTVSENRNDKVYRKIAVLIAATVSQYAGNYICFFPSYVFMENVVKHFTKKYPEVCVIVQKRGMTLPEREEFIASFKDDSGVLRIGFCVLGGSFSEGIDLPGNRLIGAVIVGAGIPAISNERNILRDFYDVRTGNGYDYAYTFPGMNTVLQAAGRVIRRDTDRGIVVLIDERYGKPLYARLFPPHWNHLQFAGNPLSLAELARRFWNNRDK